MGGKEKDITPGEEERSLVDRYRQGDAEAREILFLRYMGPTDDGRRKGKLVYRCSQLSLKGFTPEEIAEQVFNEALDKFDLSRGVNFQTFLFAVARVKCGPRPRHLEKDPSDFEEYREQLEEIIQESKLGRDISKQDPTYRYVYQLSPQEEDVLLARLVQGKNYEEISRELNVSEAAIRQAFHKGKEKLLNAKAIEFIDELEKYKVSEDGEAGHKSGFSDSIRVGGKEKILSECYEKGPSGYSPSEVRRDIWRGRQSHTSGYDPKGPPTSDEYGVFHQSGGGLDKLFNGITVTTATGAFHDYLQEEEGKRRARNLREWSNGRNAESFNDKARKMLFQDIDALAWYLIECGELPRRG